MIQNSKPERNNQALFKSLYQANEAVERMEVKGGIRLSIREAFCMSYQELRSICCKNERSEKKVNMYWMLPT